MLACRGSDGSEIDVLSHKMVEEGGECSTLYELLSIHLLDGEFLKEHGDVHMEFCALVGEECHDGGDDTNIFEVGSILSGCLRVSVERLY